MSAFIRNFHKLATSGLSKVTDIFYRQEAKALHTWRQVHSRAEFGACAKNLASSGIPPRPRVVSSHKDIRSRERHLGVPFAARSASTISNLEFENNLRTYGRCQIARQSVAGHLICQKRLASTKADNQVFWLDTLTTAKSFERAGVSSTQAEELTHLLSDLLNKSADRMGESYFATSTAEKLQLQTDNALKNLQQEFQTRQENETGKLKLEIERLKVECDKIRAELRYEVDKVNAGHRLDLNLEKGRIRDELLNQDNKSTSATRALDKDINLVRQNMEAMKGDVIKYCVGTIVSTTALGLALLRILM
ncbi:hypothetical protein CYMTET_49471 [Cymbomonas tetramitiformis]|uniref:Mitochondrial protein n=1 Tax=Cymbomonas tetramitiformis TaxID=36881 RepID=A0AAE0BQ53_9CHLO|nr:hypothetical protein CYMTET_49471 [Cymbomonas tetramitiformis]